MEQIGSVTKDIVESLLPLERKAWEVYTLEHLTTGPVFNTQHLLIVRGGGNPSQVILTTSDVDRAHHVEQRVRRALIALPAAEFESFIGMNRKVRTGGSMNSLPS